jgi:hypothetical protein
LSSISPKANGRAQTRRGFWLFFARSEGFLPQAKMRVTDLIVVDLLEKLVSEEYITWILFVFKLDIFKTM